MIVQGGSRSACLQAGLQVPVETRSPPCTNPGEGQSVPKERIELSKSGSEPDAYANWLLRFRKRAGSQPSARPRPPSIPPTDPYPVLRPEPCRAKGTPLTRRGRGIEPHACCSLSTHPRLCSEQILLVRQSPSLAGLGGHDNPARVLRQGPGKKW